MSYEPPQKKENNQQYIENICRIVAIVIAGVTVYFFVIKILFL